MSAGPHPDRHRRLFQQLWPRGVGVEASIALCQAWDNSILTTTHTKCHHASPFSKSEKQRQTQDTSKYPQIICLQSARWPLLHTRRNQSSLTCSLRAPGQNCTQIARWQNTARPKYQAILPLPPFSHRILCHIDLPHPYGTVPLNNNLQHLNSIPGTVVHAPQRAPSHVWGRDAQHCPFTLPDSARLHSTTPGIDGQSRLVPYGRFWAFLVLTGQHVIPNML